MSKKKVVKTVTTTTTTTTTISTTENSKHTHISIAFDGSGSMQSCINDAISQVNNYVKTIADASRNLNISTSFSFYLFGYGNNPNAVTQPISNVEISSNLTVNHLINPLMLGNQTPLLDAIGMVLTDIKNHPKFTDKNATFLTLIITDGEDNGSLIYDKFEVSKLTRFFKDKDHVTCAYMVPPGGKSSLMSYGGISEDNIQEWNNSSQGVRQSGAVTNTAINNYMTARSSGSKSTNKFFVQIDLSKSKTKDLKQLNDVTNKFKSYDVSKEFEIRDFVESVVKTNYIKGSVYYQISKKEKIQASKQILVMEKGKKTIYGGSEARKLIGLPDNSNADVDPVDLSKFLVFVQSKSFNRKLVRGTKVLIDVNAS